MIVDIDVRDYWQVAAEQQGMIQHSADAQAFHGMTAWRVRGVVVTDGRYYCGCDYCQGHSGRENHYNVDVFVSCSIDKVPGLAEEKILLDEGADGEEVVRWGEGPFIESVGSFGNVEADIAHFRRMRGYC